MTHGRYRGGVVTLLVGTVIATSAVVLSDPLIAQEEVTAVLRGRVLKEAQPVSGQVVQLHRVSSEAAGEIDSVATNNDGDFRFVLPYMPDPEVRREVFFASARFRGILYFGAPVSQPADLDSVYTLEVYDTISAPEHGAAFPVETRNVFAEQVEGGWSFTDLFEIRNDGARTVVGRPGSAVWTYPLPSGAENVQLGDGDLSEDAFRFEEGSVRVYAPIPPGSRLFVFRYNVPDLAGGLPLPGATERVELLVREPAPALAVDGLSMLAPVEIEPGSSFRRFAGEDISEGLVTFTAAEEPPTIPFRWLVVGMASALAALGLWTTLRRPPASRAELLIAIAQLDEAWESEGDPSDAIQRKYERRRGRLMSRLPPRP